MLKKTKSFWLTVSMLLVIANPVYPDSTVHKNAVLMMEKLGGFRQAHESRPRLLTVFSDGRVEVLGKHATTLSSKRLLTIMKTVVDELEFGSIDSARIAALLKGSARKNARLAAFADAPLTRITVQLEDGSHTVEIYALSLKSMVFTKHSELQRLRQVEETLDWLVAWSQAGGESAVNQALKRANQTLSGYEDAPLVSENDLLATIPMGDGRSKLQFRKVRLSNGQRVRWDLWVSPYPDKVEVRLIPLD